MSHNITIAGKAFSVEARYSEGHTLSANEAAALNQTFFENLRNNFASKAKEGATQEDFDAYALSYQFGVRTGGGGSRDPIEVEAMRIARDQIRQTIKERGLNISDYSAESISTAASRLLERDPSIREIAKERVAQMQSAAKTSIDDSLLSVLEPAKPAEPDNSDTAETASASTDESTKKGKKSAE